MCLVVASSQALAQTNDECITYMEAAATHNEIVSKQSKLAGGAYRKADERYKKAFYSGVRNAMGPGEDPTYRQLSSAGKVVVKRAEETFYNTLLNTYSGPRSSVQTVLWSLINEDIRRCADDGFPMSPLAVYGW